MTLPLGSHIWIYGPVDARDPSTKRAALLVQWKQEDGQWWARVVYLATLRAERQGLVEEWVPGHQVTPAGA